MSELANRITEMAGWLGTMEGLFRVTNEISILNERLAGARAKLPRDEMMDIHHALTFLGNAISEMSRVSRGTLEQAGVKGLDHVG
jgi:hypothetical protein